MEPDLDLGRYRTSVLQQHLVVDVRPANGLPGVVRTVSIHPALSITVAFEDAGRYASDRSEKLLSYKGVYGSRDELIASLEEFLCEPLEAMRNFSVRPFKPTLLQQPDQDANHTRLVEMVRTGAVRLPTGTSYELNSTYWRHIERYGEYRPYFVGVDPDACPTSAQPELPNVEPPLVACRLRSILLQALELAPELNLLAEVGRTPSLDEAVILSSDDDHADPSFNLEVEERRFHWLLNLHEVQAMAKSNEAQGVPLTAEAMFESHLWFLENFEAL